MQKQNNDWVINNIWAPLYVYGLYWEKTLSDSFLIIKSGNFQLIDLKLQNNTIALCIQFYFWKIRIG